MSAEPEHAATEQSRGRVAGDPVLHEFSVKHSRLVRILDERGADALVLSTAGALSWLLIGARVHVSLAGPPILSAVVHREGVEIGVFANEAARIRGEELNTLLAASAPVRLHELPWYGALGMTSDWLPSSTGWRLLDEASAALELRAARASLLPAEIERYRSLCTDAASALTDVLSAATPQTTERELTARLSPLIIGAGADPVVLLASGAARAGHRHPLPTDAALGRRAMAVVCARRGGLIANVTRWVGFSEPVPGEHELDQAIAQVEADALGALTPGARLEAVLEELKSAYPRHGLDSAEWTRHHQGGAAGYQGRDPRLSPGVPDLIHPDQAFALNPSGFDSARGLAAKIEDTVVLRSTAASALPTIDVLSSDPRWPTVQVGGRARPAVLRR
ncbi:M24 family metallopeptidase [Nesterenkonia lutea]|uniref:Xaa-Pro aminopeptidase n=1 Tax=Nesterenkonia lutea TaxID=272919 RepID=A0ABR9JH68_9MICC|nr:M24 family metallopeptidase [Nesterenkonia lutea]MBE1525264.1 Xaa-Pro aminopeptidase [Nesterenkonia lutea]